MGGKNTELGLLPNGFVDLLPPLAETEARSISVLMDKFTGFGYQRIKPPLLEFEDSLLAPGPGERLSQETFRLMDPISHRMLGVRSDITPQIARIASSRLKQEARPLRLTYANDVLRTRNSQLRTERQFCQVGCEVIGDCSVEASIELCVLAILGLKALDFKELTIDLNIPGFISGTIPADVDPDQLQIIKRSVTQRDRDALIAIDQPFVGCIVQAMEISGTTEIFTEGLAALDKEAFSSESLRDLDCLQLVCQGIHKALFEIGIADVSVTVDLLESAGFEYHKHLGFTLFSAGVHGELGRGGCYDVRFGKGDECETAKGFTLYMDTIRRACSSGSQPRKLGVLSSTSWAEIIALQKQGWVVLRGTESGIYPEGCSYRYVMGEIVSQ